MKIIVYHQPFPMGNYKVNEIVANHLSKDKSNTVYYVEQQNGAPITEEHVQQILNVDPDLVYFEMLDRETFKIVERLKCEKILLYASKGILPVNETYPNITGSGLRR
jgi:uncharacterized protein YukJ